MSVGANWESITYKDSKKLARHEDPDVRREVAAREDVRPEVLYFLAEDESPEVRRIVAENRAAPRHTDILLAKDADVIVRTGLAAKIAKVAPSLSADQREKVSRSAYEALDLLARDQITKVRQVLAEALKDVTHAPHEIIKTLALDSEIEVAGPILEYSPILTDEDLLEIIEAGPAAGGLGAISRRVEVSEGIADAIVASDDMEAIADLLANDSAQIREEALDTLIERAPSVELWHEPLVARPKLPDGAATRLAQFLADDLLGVLQERADLDGGALESVKSVVRRRLGGTSSDHDLLEATGREPVQDYLQVTLPIEMARRLHGADKLGENVIAKALHAGDHSFVLAALAVRADVDEKVARKIFSEKSGKGVVALTWKAGLTAKVALVLQQRMARIAPADVLAAKKGGVFPLDEEDMAWQIEFFAKLAN